MLLSIRVDGVRLSRPSLGSPSTTSATQTDASRRRHQEPDLWHSGARERSPASVRDSVQAAVSFRDVIQQLLEHCIAAEETQPVQRRGETTARHGTDALRITLLRFATLQLCLAAVEVPQSLLKVLLEWLHLFVVIRC